MAGMEQSRLLGVRLFRVGAQILFIVLALIFGTFSDWLLAISGVLLLFQLVHLLVFLICLLCHSV